MINLNILDNLARMFDGPMAHITSKKVNMLLLWSGPDGEDIYDSFHLDAIQ